MSIEALKWAFEQEDVPPGPRFVLVALANRANEEGGDCYPSIAWIKRKTGFSDSTIRDYLNALEVQFQKLSKSERRRDDGGKSSNEYQLSLPTPPTAAPRRGVSPYGGGAPRRAAADPPPQSGGHETKDLNERVKTKEQQQGALVSERPDWLPAEWDAFVADRKERRKALSTRAAAMAMKELAALRAAGQDPAAVLLQSIRKGWAGLFAVKEEPAAGATLADRNRAAAEAFKREHAEEANR
jgi:hypothetical protein